MSACLQTNHHPGKFWRMLVEDNWLKILEKVETRPLKIAENMEEKFEGSHSEEYKEYGWRITLGKVFRTWKLSSMGGVVESYLE